MAKDLFSAPFDSISFPDIDDFLGMGGPIETRPDEGTLLDYKSDESGDWVEAIAAFANTAGGLVFLGVQSDRNKNNAPVATPGILFSGDIKARLTSKIVSQVTPRPEFDVVASPLPSDLKPPYPCIGGPQGQVVTRKRCLRVLVQLKDREPPDAIRRNTPQTILPGQTVRARNWRCTSVAHHPPQCTVAKPLLLTSTTAGRAHWNLLPPNE